MSKLHKSFTFKHPSSGDVRYIAIVHKRKVLVVNSDGEVVTYEKDAAKRFVQEGYWYDIKENLPEGKA